MNVRKFHVDVWDADIHLIWPVTPTQFRNYVRRALDKPKYDSPDNFAAMCHSDCRTAIIGFRQWTGTAEDQGNLVHELFHATAVILKTCETPLCDSTEEVYAYLLDSLFRNAIQLMSK